MKTFRRTTFYLTFVIGTWLLVSFGGTMVDPANAPFWTSSLMWSLLAFMIVSPALVILNDDILTKSKSTSAESSRDASTEQSFVNDDSSGTRTLWPEPEQDQPESTARA